MADYEAFTRFLVQAEARTFVLGAWDCLIFADGAQQALHGRGFAGDWMGLALNEKGRPRTSAALRRLTGHRTIAAALSDRMPTIKGHPGRGAIALIEVDRYLGFALGVVTGQSAAFLADPKGFHHLPLAGCIGFWGW